MAYKFQRGEAILSGALLQEGNIEIESGFEFAMHDVTVLDTSRNLTVAGMSGSGNLEVGGTVRLDGVEEADAEATDRMYFLDADGLMKSDAIEDVRDFLIFDSVSGDATIAHGGALTIAAGAVENSMLSGGIASSKIAELNAFDTDALTEGASSLYYTDDRVHAALSVSDSNSIDMTYDAAGQFSADLRISGSQLEVVGEGLRLSALAADGTTMELSSDSLSVIKVPNALSQGEGIAVFEFDGSGTATVGLADSVAGDGLSYSSGVLAVGVHGNGGIEIVSDALQIKEASVTNAMLSGAIASGKIAELNAFDTDDLSEGASNLYYTEARWDTKMAAADTDDLAEGASNLYFTDARARAAVSVVDAGGDGSLTYNSGSGEFTFTGPSASEVRAHLSVTDNGGDGSLSYDSSTGVISYTGPSADEVRAHFSTGYMIDLAAGEFSIDAAEFSGSWDAVLATKSTDNLAEGSNLYFTDARARDAVSVTDAGGDGSLAYDSSTGVFTYTGPSADEVRAHLSVADTNSIDMSVTDGQFSADLLLSGSSLEVTAAGLRLAAAAAGAGLAWTDGVLSVEGSAVTLKESNGVLSEGYNYMNDLTGPSASLTMSLPSSGLEVGDIVHVKAGDLIENESGPAVITINAASGHNIDGEASIVLESPYAAVSLVYVTANEWRIV